MYGIYIDLNYNALHVDLLIGDVDADSYHSHETIGRPGRTLADNHLDAHRRTRECPILRRSVNPDNVHCGICPKCTHDE